MVRVSGIFMGVSENRGFYPPNHPILIGFSMKFSPSILGSFTPLFLVQHPYGRGGGAVFDFGSQD